MHRSCMDSTTNDFTRLLVSLDREEKGEDHFYGACPLNLQGLDAKTKNDKQSRAEYVNGKNMQLYAIMCFVEPKISADSFN